jgi:hypothetical protein
MQSMVLKVFKNKDILNRLRTKSNYVRVMELIGFFKKIIQIHFVMN